MLDSVETISPLDLAAQLTLLRWNGEECLIDQVTIERLVGELMSFAGITSLDMLTHRKARGLTVFRQLPVYPKADIRDVEDLVLKVKSYLKNLQTIPVPTGSAIAYNTSGWAPITTTASTIKISDTQYTSPLT